MNRPQDNWGEAFAYEQYMGRWSRLIASEFLVWLNAGDGLAWLDVGCGTGTLVSAILEHSHPSAVFGIDPSPAFIQHALIEIADPRVKIVQGAIEDLPHDMSGFDVVVSGLVLNFLTEPATALRSMVERQRPGGVVGAYVWDYLDRMEFLRIFWDEAARVDPLAREFDEGRRFPLCNPEALQELFTRCGLASVRTAGIEVGVRFQDFADFWGPLQMGTGPAPSYVASLSKVQHTQLRKQLIERFGGNPASPIHTSARAWAAAGLVEQAR